MSDDTSKASTGSSSIIPKLSWLGAAGIIYFNTSGGPYGFEHAVKAIPSLGWLLVGVFFVLLFFALPQALITAELSTRYKLGNIEWVCAILGRLPGAVNAYVQLFSNAFNMASYPVMFSDYFGYVTGFGNDIWGRLTLTLAFSFIVVVVNSFGVAIVGWAAIILTFVIMIPFIVWFGLDAGKIPWAAFGEFKAFPSAASVALCVSLLLWNLSGWHQVSNTANDMKHPKQLILSLLFAMIALVLNYFFPFFAGVAIQPDPSLWNSAFFAAGAFKESAALGWVLFITACLSIFGMGLSTLVTSSFAVKYTSDFSYLPEIFGKASKRGVPYVGVTTIALLGFILSQFRLNFLVQCSMVLACISYVLFGVAFIVVRYRHRKKPFLERDSYLKDTEESDVELYKVPINSMIAVFLLPFPSTILSVFIILAVPWAVLLSSLSGLVLVIGIYAVVMYMRGGWHLVLGSQQKGAEGVESSMLLEEKEA